MKLLKRLWLVGILLLLGTQAHARYITTGFVDIKSYVPLLILCEAVNERLDTRIPSVTMRIVNQNNKQLGAHIGALEKGISIGIHANPNRINAQCDLQTPMNSLEIILRLCILTQSSNPQMICNDTLHTEQYTPSIQEMLEMFGISPEIFGIFQPYLEDPR